MGVWLCGRSVGTWQSKNQGRESSLKKKLNLASLRFSSRERCPLWTQVFLSLRLRFLTQELSPTCSGLRRAQSLEGLSLSSGAFERRYFRISPFQRFSFRLRNFRRHSSPSEMLPAVNCANAYSGVTGDCVCGKSWTSEASVRKWRCGLLGVVFWWSQKVAKRTSDFWLVGLPEVLGRSLMLEPLGSRLKKGRLPDTSFSCFSCFSRLGDFSFSMFSYSVALRDLKTTLSLSSSRQRNLQRRTTCPRGTSTNSQSVRQDRKNSLLLPSVMRSSRPTAQSGVSSWRLALRMRCASPETRMMRCVSASASFTMICPLEPWQRRAYSAMRFNFSISWVWKKSQRLSNSARSWMTERLKILRKLVSASSTGKRMRRVPSAASTSSRSAQFSGYSWNPKISWARCDVTNTFSRPPAATCSWYFSSQYFPSASLYTKTSPLETYPKKAARKEAGSAPRLVKRRMEERSWIWRRAQSPLTCLTVCSRWWPCSSRSLARDTSKQPSASACTSYILINKIILIRLLAHPTGRNRPDKWAIGRGCSQAEEVRQGGIR